MRKAGSNGAATSEAIRVASLELIFQKGFEAASLRKLAQKVGIQVGSLYNYFKNKDELLVFITKTTFEQRVIRMETALEGIADPVEAFSTYIRTGVKLNTQYRQETIIGDRELSRLPKRTLDEVVRLRDKYDRRMTEIIKSGVESGVFVVEDERIATFAIMGMLSRICIWYKTNGRLSQTELQDMFVDFSLRLVGFQQSAKARPGRSKRSAHEPSARSATSSRTA